MINNFDEVILQKVSLSEDTNVFIPTNLTKEEFVHLVFQMNYDYVGYFARNAEDIYDLCHKYGFNEIAILGVVAKETGWGKHRYYNNATGQINGNGGWAKYETEYAGLEATIKNLVEKYSLGGIYFNGTTLWGINESYCLPAEGEQDYSWAKGVYWCMETIVT